MLYVYCNIVLYYYKKMQFSTLRPQKPNSDVRAHKRWKTIDFSHSAVLDAAEQGERRRECDTGND